MKLKFTFFCLFICHTIIAQKTLKNYLNSGIGFYVPYNGSLNNVGNNAILNLEAELNKHAIARLCIDANRIPFTKEIVFNNSLVKSNTKANITSIGLDFGWQVSYNKWRFYAFAGTSICFIDDPVFIITNPTTVSIKSKNLTKFAIKIAPGIKYHFKESFILFTELQSQSIFYKNQNKKNELSGIGLVFGIATRI